MHATHDETLEELRALSRKLDADAISGAFVASLSLPPAFWRAPLVALAAARGVPKHAIAVTFSDGSCKECGLAERVALEPPHDRGQCLPGDLARALVVLRAVREQPAPLPSREDKARMARLFEVIAALPPTAREAQLEKQMAAAEVCVGNKYDRRHVIETLGACGILETNEHPGFTTRWTSFAARQARPSVRVECDPPIAFWTAAHGVNAGNVATWFGHLGIKAPKATAPRVAAREAAEAKVAASAKKRAARAARETELAVGDAVAFAIGARYVAGIVIGTMADKGGRSPVIELCAWKGDALPTAAQLAKTKAAGRTWGDRLIRGPVLLVDLWTREGPGGGWSVVASGMKPPDSSHLDDPFGGSPSIQRVSEIERIAKSAGLV